MWDLVAQTGIEPWPAALVVWSLSPWTIWEVLVSSDLFQLSLVGPDLEAESKMREAISY